MKHGHGVPNSQSKILRRTITVSATSLQVQREPPLSLCFCDYKHCSADRSEEKIKKTLSILQRSNYYVTFLIQSSDSYSFRHALNFLFLIKGLLKHVFLKIVNYSLLQFAEIN